MIAIASDHAGFDLKAEICDYLKDRGLAYKDWGTYSRDVSVDYPDYAVAVSDAIISGEADRGILICGTGIGISIAANKIPGIRAALCTNSYMAKMAREHNDANIIALGGKVIGTGTAFEILDAWLEASFAGGRHSNRIGKISQLEPETGGAF